MIILGLVLYRDGVREVQDGVGDFMEPGQVSSEPGETPEELSTDLEFLHHGE